MSGGILWGRQLCHGGVGVMGSDVHRMLNSRVNLVLRTGMQWAWGATPRMKRTASFSLAAAVFSRLGVQCVLISVVGLLLIV